MRSTFQQLRSEEFSRLDRLNQVYLDYTGAGLYAESLIHEYSQQLLNHVLGNPHSVNPSSLESTRVVEEARERIKLFFDADEYDVIFTPNATGALRLVGESCPFTRDSRFVLTADNHNSINGIREFARAKGATVRYVPLTPELRVGSIEDHLGLSGPQTGLFAYPAQSNFSGVKHPLPWIETAHQMGYDVVLDAAAYVPTNPLSLKRTSPDFVPISFYKMFGFPTGIGALLVRHEVVKRLRRPWFSGGTITYVSTVNGVHLLTDGPQAFEDGTVNFLGILAVAKGLDFLESVGMERISRHVLELTKALLDGLQSLKHSNGEPLVRVYGPKTVEDRGGTVTSNLLDENGKEVPAEKVAEYTTANNISVRTGCFCNPGAAEFAFGHEPARARECFGSIPHDRFSLAEFSACLGGRPVGAVRASFGLPSNKRDVERLIEALKGFRGAKPSQAASLHTALQSSGVDSV